ncbi:hypothetical protein SPD48_06345 [Pseudogracilibacillus sp. SE30717A]|uniref:hypothetical protein n=1 Tax=Pseudogracilibacillus sp. SE30717A TaxID=3098293 RepID=UPI00300E59A9
MKRLTLILVIILIFILAACNSPQESSPTKEEETKQEDSTEETDLEEESQETEEEAEDQEEEKAPETVTEPELEEDSESTPDTNENKEEKQDTSIESTEKKEGDKHEEIVDLAYKVFDAQNKKDYDYLESIISKGTTIEKKNNIFKFNNVTYPHEQPFLTKKDVGELEFRYTHEEKADYVIVGFGAIDYENESSFTIDFEFIKENGKWKMNDMDINK